MQTRIEVTKPIDFYARCDYKKFVIYVELELVPESFLSLPPRERYSHLAEIAKTKFFYLLVQIDSASSDIKEYCRFRLQPFSKDLSIPSGYVPICYSFLSLLGGPKGYKNKDLDTVISNFDENTIQITFDGKPIPDIAGMYDQLLREIFPTEGS